MRPNGAQKAESEHDRMLRAVAEQSRRPGVRVSVGVPGYPSPRTVHGQIPDLVASAGTKVVLEVETARGRSSFRAYQKFKAFAFAQGMTFQVAVPKACPTPARMTAAAWNALPAKWWAI